MKKQNIFLSILLLLILLQSCQKRNDIEPDTKIHIPKVDAKIEPQLNDMVIFDMVQAYGFKLGQDYTLKLIEKKYPELRAQIQMVKLKFDRSFSNSISTIDSILALRFDYWSKIKLELQSQVSKTLKNYALTYDKSIDFIKLVEERSKGDIPDPIIGTFLSFNNKYLEKPELEFFHGYKYTFISKNHPKSKGIDLRIDFPKSWKAMEGDRPNVLQKFKSQNGFGLALSVILINELQGISNISEEDVRYLLNDQEYKKNLPPNSKFIRSSFTKIDNLPTLYREYETNFQQTEEQIFMYVSEYNIFYKNNSIIIQFLVGSKLSDSIKNYALFSKYKELLRAIVGSLIVENQWKNKN